MCIHSEFKKANMNVTSVFCLNVLIIHNLKIKQEARFCYKKYLFCYTYVHVQYQFKNQLSKFDTIQRHIQRKVLEVKTHLEIFSIC